MNIFMQYLVIWAYYNFSLKYELYFCTDKDKLNVFDMKEWKYVLGVFEKNAIPSHSVFCRDNFSVGPIGANTLSYQLPWISYESNVRIHQLPLPGKPCLNSKFVFIINLIVLPPLSDPIRLNLSVQPRFF